jgi:hypothetical protein
MTNVCIGEVIGKSLYLEPQYMCMIIACVCVFVHTHESMDIAYIYACVCVRSHDAAHARVFTYAPARMCVMRSRSPASGLVVGAMHGGSRRVVLTCLFVCLLCTGTSMCAATDQGGGHMITVGRSGTTRR